MKTSEFFVLFALTGLLYIVQVEGNAESLTKLWNAIYKDTSVDLERYILFSKTLNDEQKTIAELQATARQYLRIKTSDILINALITNEYSVVSTKLNEITKLMISNYDTKLIEDILYYAINEVCDSQSPSLLIDSLWHIYTPDDLPSFELMLRAQFKLMRRYTEKPSNEDKLFLHKYAFTLYKIRHDHLYGSVRGYLKSALDKEVTKLPKNLQYLFFNPNFCLMNAKHSEYLYMSVWKNDDNSHYVWEYYEKLKIDDDGPIKADVFESVAGNTTHFKVTLKSEKYKLYYYKIPATNEIAGWESKDEPMYNIWDIAFLDNDRVALSQNDYILCSTEDWYDGTRRNVAGYKKENYSTLNEECQWYLGQCDRTKLD